MQQFTLDHNLTPFIFFSVWLIFLVFVFWGMFSRKGRDFQIRQMFGAFDSLEHFGVVATYKLRWGVTETVKVLKCEQQNEIFLILEIKLSRIGGIRYSWVKVDANDLTQMQNLIKNAISGPSISNN